MILKIVKKIKICPNISYFIAFCMLNLLVFVKYKQFYKLKISYLQINGFLYIRHGKNGGLKFPPICSIFKFISRVWMLSNILLQLAKYINQFHILPDIPYLHVLVHMFILLFFKTTCILWWSPLHRNTIIWISER